MNARSRNSLLALSAAFLMPGLCAQGPGAPVPSAAPAATLSQQISDAAIRLTVEGEVVAGEVFLAGILVSLDSALCHYLTGLPPMLCDHAVLAAGFTADSFSAQLDCSLMPAGMVVYAQGVIAGSRGIAASELMELVAGGDTGSDR